MEEFEVAGGGVVPALRLKGSFEVEVVVRDREIGKGSLRDLDLQGGGGLLKRPAGLQARFGDLRPCKRRMVLQGRARVKGQEERMTYPE